MVCSHRKKPTNGEEQYLLNNQKQSQLHWPPGGVQTCIRDGTLYIFEQLVRKNHPSGNLRMRLIRFPSPSSIRLDWWLWTLNPPSLPLLTTKSRSAGRLEGFSGDFDPFENHFAGQKNAELLLRSIDELLSPFSFVTDTNYALTRCQIDKCWYSPRSLVHHNQCQKLKKNSSVRCRQ